MLGIFPNGLNTTHEDVDRGTFWHFTWTLQMLIHAPKLVNSAEVCEGLDILLIPTVALILGKKCVLVVQSSTEKSQLANTIRNLPFRNLLLSCFGLFCHSGNRRILINHFSILNSFDYNINLQLIDYEKIKCQSRDASTHEIIFGVD